MTQRALLAFGEVVDWILLQITGIAVLCFAIWNLVSEHGLPSSRLRGPFQNRTVSLYELVILAFCLVD